MSKETGQMRAKQRIENVRYSAAGEADSQVVEAGQIVEGDHPFVTLHPQQFEPVVLEEPDASVDEVSAAKVRVAPSVRSHAEALDVELADVVGSGVNGAITKADVDAHAEAVAAAKETV